METEKPLVVSFPEAATILRVYESTIRRWVDQGKLVDSRIGGRRYIVYSSIESAIQNGMEKSA